MQIFPLRPCSAFNPSWDRSGFPTRPAPRRTLPVVPIDQPPEKEESGELRDDEVTGIGDKRGSVPRAPFPLAIAARRAVRVGGGALGRGGACGFEPPAAPRAGPRPGRAGWALRLLTSCASSLPAASSQTTCSTHSSLFIMRISERRKSRENS